MILAQVEHARVGRGHHDGQLDWRTDLQSVRPGSGPGRIEWRERSRRCGELRGGRVRLGHLRVDSHSVGGAQPVRPASYEGVVESSTVSCRSRTRRMSAVRSRAPSRISRSSSTQPSAPTRPTRATRILGGRQPASFVGALDSTSLRGARLGVLTEHFGTEADDQEGTRIVRAALTSMKARGAEVIDIAIPGLDSVINRAGVIDYELKFDLIDYLASIPTRRSNRSPRFWIAVCMTSRSIHSFGDASAPAARDSDAYRSALAQRTVARDMVVAFLEANKLDALVYPTVRRKAALINEPQRGANCQLSAVTGLPALTMPAGFTPDGLPIGVELLGRPLADTRLLSLAYDYEQSVHPRRPPARRRRWSTDMPRGRS